MFVREIFFIYSIMTYFFKDVKIGIQKAFFLNREKNYKKIQKTRINISKKTSINV